MCYVYLFLSKGAYSILYDILYILKELKSILLLIHFRNSYNAISSTSTITINSMTKYCYGPMATCLFILSTHKYCLLGFGFLFLLALLR